MSEVFSHKEQNIYDRKYVVRLCNIQSLYLAHGRTKVYCRFRYLLRLLILMEGLSIERKAYEVIAMDCTATQRRRLLLKESMSQRFQVHMLAHYSSY